MQNVTACCLFHPPSTVGFLLLPPLSRCFSSKGLSGVPSVSFADRAQCSCLEPSTTVDTQPFAHAPFLAYRDIVVDYWLITFLGLQKKKKKAFSIKALKHTMLNLLGRGFCLALRTMRAQGWKHLHWTAGYLWLCQFLLWTVWGAGSDKALWHEDLVQSAGHWRIR